MDRISLENGKYIIEHDNGTNFKAYRYGEAWRDLTGDGMILALLQAALNMEDLLLEREYEYSLLCERIFEHIKHGDQEHQDWLKKELNKFFEKNNDQK